MTKRELIRNLIAGEIVPRCGFWLGKPHADTWPILHRHFNTSTERELRTKLRDDVSWICPQFYEDAYADPSGHALFDAGLDREKHGSVGPLADAETVADVEAFPWPDPKYLNFDSCLRDLREAGDVYRMSGFWTCYWHNACDLFGMENYLVKMHTAPEVVHAVTNRVCEFYLEANERFFTAAKGLVDGFFFGNDFGCQRGLIISPAQFEEFIFPWLKRFAAQGKRHGLQVIVHSCGSIFPLIGRMIEAGVDCLHPLQALAKDMNAESLARTYKGRIAFLGGIDAQELLTRGTPDQIRADVRRVQEILGPRLIVSPSHETILPNVPPENVEALARAAAPEPGAGAVSSVGRALAGFALALLLPMAALAAPASTNAEWRASALKSATPDEEIVRADIDADGKPDMIERWWNGKRVRWLDENSDMNVADTRGDQVWDLLQIDANNDGVYDSLGDVNVKWADLDQDGIPDFQAWVLHPDKFDDKTVPWPRGHWMIFQNFDKRGVLGWMDWEKYKFDCWGYTGRGNWLPNYHGNTVFLKIHAPVFSLNDPKLNWENPFAFYDFDNDGVSEMAMRWLDPPQNDPGKTTLTGRLNEAFVTFDLDNDSGKDNEMDFDMSLRGAGGPGIDYREMKIPIPGFRGNPKFDPCFQYQDWRRIEDVRYMPHDKGYDAFFTNQWERTYFVFDEDDDDRRWERVEIYYPNAGADPKSGPIDIYSVKRWGKKDAGLPGLCGHPQADTLGDRGEYDTDNSGRGKLYIGVFDRKLHLAGAEWGAWTVDKNAEFHAGSSTPTPTPAAPRVEEVVKYTDTDTNGFLDTIEFDYDGDRTIDLRVCLLDYAIKEGPAPDVTPLLDTQALQWKGLHETFNAMAQDAWIEALGVYRAAWRRGLTTPELDKLAAASSKAQRYHNGYWLKEKIFRLLRQRLAEFGAANADQAATLKQLEQDLTRAYYLGRYPEYVRLIAKVPGR